MSKTFDEIMEIMDYFIELERGKRMLSKEEIEKKMQAFDCPKYLRETCYEPIRKQAQLAIELQAKLDEADQYIGELEIGNTYIRETANSEVAVGGDIIKLVNKTMVQLFETSKAKNFVLQDLKDKDGNEYEVLVQKKDMLNPTQKWKEAQAKLDAIEKLCLDEMVVRGDMSDRNFAHGYNSALARVMQILRGDE